MTWLGLATAKAPATKKLGIDSINGTGRGAQCWNGSLRDSQTWRKLSRGANYSKLYSKFKKDGKLQGIQVIWNLRVFRLHCVSINLFFCSHGDVLTKIWQICWVDLDCPVSSVSSLGVHLGFLWVRPPLFCCKRSEEESKVAEGHTALGGQTGNGSEERNFPECIYYLNVSSFFAICASLESSPSTIAFNSDTRETFPKYWTHPNSSGIFEFRCWVADCIWAIMGWWIGWLYGNQLGR